MIKQTKTKKSARLEARLPQNVYALLQRAAEVEGRSISDFVVSAAKEAAERTIAQRELMQPTLEDQMRFAEALLDPAPPTPAMKRAAAAHKELIDPS
ncbi:MAG TPA: DUF1778 domain-containing protein [Phycisphaerae bacterium]|nr:DUF1778 domain-containing protein [Phycisphaerae bacterium]